MNKYSQVPIYFPITTICGSMRFYSQMIETAQELSRAGYIVLMPFVTFKPEEQATNADKRMLDRMHFAKIDLSDCIHVVTDHIVNYVGESTKNEIEHASRTGKAINMVPCVVSVKDLPK